MLLAALHPVQITTHGPNAPDIAIFAHDDRDREHPLARCNRACVLALPRGDYWVQVSATPGAYEYEHRLRVRGPSTVTIDPGDKETRRWGVALGTTFLATGVVCTFLAGFYEWGQAGTEGGRGAHVGVFTVGAGLSAVLSIVGWSFASKGSPGLEVKQTSAVALSASGLSIRF